MSGIKTTVHIDFPCREFLNQLSEKTKECIKLCHTETEKNNKKMRKYRLVAITFLVIAIFSSTNGIARR